MASTRYRWYDKKRFYFLRASPFYCAFNFILADEKYLNLMDQSGAGYGSSADRHCLLHTVRHATYK
jgi:hypothetical protein